MNGWIIALFTPAFLSFFPCLSCGVELRSCVPSNLRKPQIACAVVANIIRAAGKEVSFWNDQHTEGGKRHHAVTPLDRPSVARDLLKTIRTRSSVAATLQQGQAIKSCE